MVRFVPLVLLLGCTAPGMRSLHAPPAEVTTPIHPACEPADRGERGPDVPDGVDCKVQKRRDQTWRSQSGLFESDVRLVLLGDAGVRAKIPGGPTARDEVGRGPLAVAESARKACGGAGCDGVVFLGDNLYDAGLNDDVDTRFLRAFATAWSWAGPQWYVQGNHDWGAFSGMLVSRNRPGPDRDRAQRLFRDVRQLSAGGELDLRGDSHFWGTAAGAARLTALDTNFLVRRCKDRGDTIRCKGDPGKERDDRIRIANVIERSVAGSVGPSIVVGHHPWLSHGEHGQAGDYRDVGGSLWRGAALRRVLDDIVGRSAQLYVSGHDHNTQVGRISDQTLAVVVGAGGKTTAPGEDTEPGGERHLDGIEHEVYCQLGYAVVDVSDRGLVLETRTLPHPVLEDEDLRECLAELAERRPDLAVPEGETCRRWRFAEGSGWSAGEDCGP